MFNFHATVSCLVKDVLGPVGQDSAHLSQDSLLKKRTSSLLYNSKLNTIIIKYGHLQAVVAQLRELISNVRSDDKTNTVLEPISVCSTKTNHKPPPNKSCEEDPKSVSYTHTGPLDPNERSPHGYYSQHHLFRFFREVIC